jgi:hypothetical protein
MIFNMTPYRRPITLVPVPTLEKSNYTYTGAAITPTVTGYDSALMTQAGTASAVSAGTYSVTYSLADPRHYRWADGTTEDKTLYWTINKARYSLYVAKTGTLQYTVGITAPRMLSASDAASFSLNAEMRYGRFNVSVGSVEEMAGPSDGVSRFSVAIGLTRNYSNTVTDYMTVTLTYTGGNGNIMETESKLVTVTE